MAEGQRWVGAAKGPDAHAAEAGVVQPFGVVVVVAQYQDSFSRAVPYVEHQPPVAPRVRVGDVAQADDRVVGVYAAAPFPPQVVVHFLDVPERAVPRCQHRAVRQVQVRPAPGPFWRTLAVLTCAALVVAAQVSGWAQDEDFVPVTDAML